MKITAVILTHNNQDTLKRTLNSLAFCSQIIIIDDYSADETVSLARAAGAQVYQRRLKQNWAAQRNFGLQKADHSWVLFIDSDEVVSRSLKKEIQTVLPGTDKNGFLISRQDVFLGKVLKHGETGHIKLLRLGKKNKGKWQRAVHETWQIEGKIGQLTSPILHLRDLSISQFIKRINHYTDIDAQQLAQEGKPFTFGQFFFKPLGKFIYNYIFLAGFLDGMPGFIFAFLMSLHSIIVRVKLWENDLSA